MPRRNYGRSRVREATGRDAAQRSKGRKRRSGWHRGNGSDMDVAWRTHGATLPATGVEADPTQAAPHRIITSSDRRNGRYGAKVHGDAL